MKSNMTLEGVISRQTDGMQAEAVESQGERSGLGLCDDRGIVERRKPFPAASEARLNVMRGATDEHDELAEVTFEFNRHRRR